MSSTAMSGSNNSALCDDVDKISSDNKRCTSYAQKVEHCKDGAENSGDNKSNNTTDINALSDGMGSLDISDDKLFADPPPNEDCSICMLPMPFSIAACGVTTSYQSCCGKILCGGCMLATDAVIEKGKMKDCCAFCRVPPPKSNKELMKRIKRRMKLNDPGSFYLMGTYYYQGERGLPQSKKKATELWIQAAELGHLEAHHSLSLLYLDGESVEKDMEKAIHHWELAAIGGHVQSRHNLGTNEIEKWNYKQNSNNMYRAMKHFTIAARAGLDESLKQVGMAYRYGYVTKDEYAKTLRAHKDSIDEMKSEQRVIAWALLMPNMTRMPSN